MAAWSRVRTQHKQTKRSDAVAHSRVIGYRHDSNQTQRLVTVALRTSCMHGDPPRVGPKPSIIENPSWCQNVVMMLKLEGEEEPRTLLTLLFGRWYVQSTLQPYILYIMAFDCQATLIKLLFYSYLSTVCCAFDKLNYIQLTTYTSKRVNQTKQMKKLSSNCVLVV